MTGFNQNVDLDTYLKDAEPGLERAVLRVLQHRVGREMAISRAGLVEAVHSLGFEAGDRQIRVMSNKLRKDGRLICSTGGTRGGYWLAKDWNELNEFLRREVLPRALDLLDTEKALKDSAEKRWGIQHPTLFDL